MTAQGSRRAAFCLVLAACGLLAWWLWPRQAARATALAEAAAAAPTAAARQDAARNPGPVPPIDRDIRATRHAIDAGSGGDCLPARRVRLGNIRDGLDPSRSAREAYAHALLGEAIEQITPHGAEAERRAIVRVEAAWQAARRRWPDDLDIAWQAASACTAKLGCDAQQALDHLLELDPANAAAWWLAMRDAWERGDVAAYDDALSHAAASRGSDARTGSVFLALRPLLAGAPPEESCLRVDDAAELQKVFGHPPTAADLAWVEAWTHEFALEPTLAASAFAGCRERDAGPLSPRRRSDCIASLSVLAGGDTLLEQSIALPLLIQLAGDSADGLAYRERYRRMLYLSRVAPPTLVAGDPSSLFHAGEVASMRQAAIASRRWPPPADWLPPASPQRMLVTRGRLPPGAD